MAIPLERLKAECGEEYPLAVTWLGVRMPLRQEREFVRVYTSEDGKQTYLVSRFIDGSVSMLTLLEVQAAWPNWSEAQRRDFCYACDWLGLGDHPDLPDILRFVMRLHDLDRVSNIAASVAQRLPRDEAFDLLCEALRAKDDHTANITKAITLTKHPGAEAVLREHLQRVWSEPDLWDDDPFTNWRAFDATCCIEQLLELGATPDQFEEKVRLLAAHPCAGNRNSCSTYLRQHYAWLPTLPR